MKQETLSMKHEIILLWHLNLIVCLPPKKKKSCLYYKEKISSDSENLIALI